MSKLIGTNPNQVPSNADLGTAAFMDATEFLTSRGSSLSAVNAVIPKTAVDVFVYDTSQDSDGGAWRKRCQHLSWYNEKLNTTTRGSRKEFPSVAVIISEDKKVTIYDGDDPNLPMWMVFDNTNSDGAALVSTGDNRNWTSIQMLNGRMAVGMGYGNTTGMGVDQVDFISDSGWRIRTGGGSNYKGTFNGSIAQRRDTTFDGIVLGNLVNETVNDIAMTVLPGAPIDAATGLPVPTIAVATDGGVSVIKDDGTVVSTASSIYTVGSIQILPTGEIYHSQGYNGNNGFCYNNNFERLSGMAVATYANSSTFWYAIDGIGNDSSLLGGGRPDENAVGEGLDTAVGTASGLTTIALNSSSLNDGMVAWRTSSYNTGWMPGNIKLATLSDTDATNITFADKQLIDEPYFNTSTGWYFNGATGPNGAASTTGSGWTLSGGKITMSNGGGDVYAVIPVVNGVQYVMQLTFDTTGNSAVTSNVSWGFRSLANSGYISESQNQTILENNTAGQTKQIFWTANTTGYILTRCYCDENLSIDNWTVFIAEEDRSVNGKGLQVFGNVTKNPVATGADLVGYGGFSYNDYLVQPYNTDLNFGTNDFCVMGWINPNNGVGPFLGHGDASNDGFLMTVNALGNFDVGYLSNSTGFAGNNGNDGALLNSNGWNHVVAVSRSQRFYIYVNGKEHDFNWDHGAADWTTRWTEPVTIIGGRTTAYPTSTNSGHFNSTIEIALFRLSTTVPSAEQIKKIYNDEKMLFQENAKCTLYGSSDAVTALAYDNVTQTLHVGTSDGRSDFQGLRRVNNTTRAVGTAISAVDGFIVEE